MTQFNERLDAFTSHRNPKGCLPEELAFLKTRYGDSLPESYVLFMAVVGNGVDDFLRGSDFVYRQLHDIREAADQLLRDGGLKPLDAADFVFAMHQGYQFYFFHDGAVYYYQEGGENIEKRHESFEQFFDSVVLNLEKRRLARNSQDSKRVKPL